jgi:hypothetical protein
MLGPDVSLPLWKPVFIETGTLFGDTVQAMAGMCASVISVELDPVLHARSRQRLRRLPNVHLYLGDVIAELPKILSSLAEPAVFWLDAHYSGGITGRGSIDDPILESLRQIRSHRIKNHLIFIDDARTFDGIQQRPDLLDIFAALKMINPEYRMVIQNDMIVATPKSGF